MGMSNSGRARITAAITVGLLVGAAALFATSSPGAPATGSADLSVTKADAVDPVNAETAIDYTIEVTNLGPDTAANAVVVDKLPKGTEFVSATATVGSCSAKGAKITCELGDLAGAEAYGESVISVRLNAPSKPGTVTNVADVSSDTPDPVEANNSAAEETVIAAAGTPTCRGVAATIVGTAAGETLRGGNGRDVIVAGGGDDTIAALKGKDVICAGGGDDEVKGGGSVDRVFGGPGTDQIKGGGDRDRLLGGGGRDLLQGRSGDDTIRGGGKADRLRGGTGNDRLAGGPGRDRCNGGAGDDTKVSC